MADSAQTLAAVAAPGHQDLWRLDGRIALVTGASAGLGARFARVLHGAGARVLATARRAEPLDRLASECGDRMETMAGDIADARHREMLVERIRALGHLDVLVNNAGMRRRAHRGTVARGPAPGDRRQPGKRAGFVSACRALPAGSAGHQR